MAFLGNLRKLPGKTSYWYHVVKYRVWGQDGGVSLFGKFGFITAGLVAGGIGVNYLKRENNARGLAYAHREEQIHHAIADGINTEKGQMELNIFELEEAVFRARSKQIMDELKNEAGRFEFGYKAFPVPSA